MRFQLFLSWIVVVVGISIMVLFLRCLNVISTQHHDIVSLQMDRDEIKGHTDMLAGIIRTQQYQIDVLTAMKEN